MPAKGLLLATKRGFPRGALSWVVSVCVVVWQVLSRLVTAICSYSSGVGGYLYQCVRVLSGTNVAIEHKINTIHPSNQDASNHHEQPQVRFVSACDAGPRAH